jgi:hypothetical protein
LRHGYPYNKPRRYLAARPLEPGLSSTNVASNIGRDHPVGDLRNLTNR